MKASVSFCSVQTGTDGALREKPKLRVKAQQRVAAASPLASALDARQQQRHFKKKKSKNGAVLSDLDILPTSRRLRSSLTRAKEENKSGSWLRWTLKTVPTRISNPRHHTQARGRERPGSGERERERESCDGGHTPLKGWEKGGQRERCKDDEGS